MAQARRSRFIECVAGGGWLAAAVTSCGSVMTRPASTPPLARPAELAVQAVSFPSQSGSTIRAWFLSGTPGAGAVLLLHGVGDNRTSMVSRARFLHRTGYSVLLLDFQAHGESAGSFITFGALESLDAQAALAFLRGCSPNERVGVIGVSMGGAATLVGPGPIEADAFVLESVYPTVRQALENRLDVWLGPFRILNRLLTPLVIREVGAETGVSETALRPIERISRVGAPVLVIAGTRDRYTPLDESVALFEHAPEPKELWAVSGAGHEDLHAFAGESYERRVGDFLARHLRVSSALPAPPQARQAGRDTLGTNCGG